MISDEHHRLFHHKAATTLRAMYEADPAPPIGLEGVIAWHLALATEWAAAITAALNEAETQITQQNARDARTWCERALEYLDRLPEQDRPAFVLRTYSLTWTVLDFAGQHEEALHYAQLLQTFARTIAQPNAEGGAWLALGRSQRALSDFANAERSLREALNISRQSNALPLEAEALFHLGKTQQLQGRHFEAIHNYNAAHERGVVIDDRLTIAKIITSLGDLYRILGAGRQATEHYARALQIEEHLPGKLGIAIVQEKLALSYLDFGETDQALRFQAESLMLREQLNDTVGIARACTVLGIIHSARGDHLTAIEAYNRALQIERSLQNTHGLVSIHNRLGDAYRTLGHYGEASTHYEQALVFARQLQDTVGMALIYERLGALAREWQDEHTAKQHLGAALALRQQLGHYDEQHNLREQLRKLGDKQ